MKRSAAWGLAMAALGVALLVAGLSQDPGAGASGATCEGVDPACGLGANLGEGLRPFLLALAGGALALVGLALALFSRRSRG